MTWINDRCDEPPGDGTTEQRAAAILRLHGGCTPHCPRFLGALPYAPIPPHLETPRFLR